MLIHEPRKRSSRIATMQAIQYSEQAESLGGRQTRERTRALANGGNMAAFRMGAAAEGKTLSRVERSQLRDQQKLRQSQIDAGQDEWLFYCEPCVPRALVS